MLKYRVFTAIIAIPLLLLAIFKLSDGSFAIFSLALMMVAAYEWAQLTGLKKILPRLLYCFLVLLLIFSCAYSLATAVSVFLLAILGWLWLAVAVVAYNKEKSPLLVQYRFVRRVIGLVLLAAGWLSLAAMKMHPSRGPEWLLYVLLLVWLVDSGAYFVGKSFGKTFMAPQVSPKKTWQGLWGGLLAAVFVIVVGNFYLVGVSDHRLAFIVMSIVAALMSVFGDLSVSLLKRLAGVKDSGVFFPGHGGMLDRVDSLLPALLVFAASAVLLYQ